MSVRFGYASADPESEQSLLIYCREGFTNGSDGPWSYLDFSVAEMRVEPTSNELDRLLIYVRRKYGLIPLEELSIRQLDYLEQCSRFEIVGSAWLTFAFSSELAACTGLELAVCYAWLREGMIADLQFLQSLEPVFLLDCVLKATKSGIIGEIMPELIQKNIARLRDLDTEIFLPHSNGFSDSIFLIDRNFCRQVWTWSGTVDSIIAERTTVIDDFVHELRLQDPQVQFVLEVAARCGRHLKLVHDLVDDCFEGRIADRDEIYGWTAKKWGEYLQVSCTTGGRVPSGLSSPVQLAAYISFLERSWSKNTSSAAEIRVLEIRLLPDVLECFDDQLDDQLDDQFDPYLGSKEAAFTKSEDCCELRDKEAS